MTNLVSTQVEQLQRIGGYLRQVRQEQGLTLDMIANNTFIRLPLLQAIESGEYQDLPQPIFIQGFIRRYADSLGLDGRALSQEFSVHAPPLPLADDLLTEVTDGSSPDTRLTGNGLPTLATLDVPEPPNLDASLSEKPKIRLESSARSPRRSRPTILLWILSLAGLGLAGVGLWAVLRGTPQSSSPDLPETPSSPSPPPPEAAPFPAVVEPSVEAPSAPSAPVTVKVSLSDRSWLSITADGKPLYEGVVTKGYQKTWTAQETLVIQVGNAAAVSLAVNGEAPVAAGAPGAVKTFTFTPNSTATAITSP